MHSLMAPPEPTSKTIPSFICSTQQKQFLERTSWALRLMGWASIPSGVGGAMAMYLEGVSVFTIMFVWCWTSDAFIRYIHRQAQWFSSGVSIKMIAHHSSYTIPDNPIGIEDPRISGNTGNLSVRSQNGPHVSTSSMPRLVLDT
jgi:hypothetical protein